MKLHMRKGTDAGRTVEPSPAGFAVGRGKDNDLVLAEEGASRHHCRIEQREANWFVEDLGSMNGVRVNGRRIEQCAQLADGDVIEICGHEMQVDLGGGAQPPIVVSRPATSEIPVGAARREESPAEEEAREPRAPLPWGRISLLAGMCLLIAALAWLWQSGPGPEGTDAAAPSPAASEEQPPTVKAPDPLSDQELDRLIAEQEKLDESKGTSGIDAAALPVPATPDGPGTGPADTAKDNEGEDEEGAPAGAAGAEIAGATDMILVQSTPPGAKVFIDDVEKGTTPAIVTGIEKGRHRLTLQLAGYQDHQRLIHVPDVPARTPYPLRQKPNTLHVSSEPGGVSVWRGSQWLGVTPVLLTELPAGEMTLTFALAGTAPRREKVTISAVRGEQLHVDMKPELGDLTITSYPPGCQVLVDSVPMGTTVSDADGPGAPGVLRIPNLLAGERTVQVEHPCGARRIGKLAVAPGQNCEQTVRLWVPDTQVVLLDGTIANGMLFERNPQGDIVLAQTPQPKDMMRYLKPRIRSERPLTPEEAQAAFQKVMNPGGAEANKGQARTDTEERWGDEAAPGKQPAAEPARTARDGAPPEDTERIPEFDDETLAKTLANSTKLGMLRQYKGATFQISGPVSAIRRDGRDGVVRIGQRFVCEFDRKIYEAERAKLVKLKDAESPATVRGRFQKFEDDRLVLVDCMTVETGKEDDRQ